MEKYKEKGQRKKSLTKVDIVVVSTKSKLAEFLSPSITIVSLKY